VNRYPLYSRTARPNGLTSGKGARYPPYSKTDSTKSPASGAGKVRERGLMSPAGRVSASRVHVDEGAFCSQSGGGAYVAAAVM
jgi:hypothetical protein